MMTDETIRRLKEVAAQLGTIRLRDDVTVQVADELTQLMYQLIGVVDHEKGRRTTEGQQI